MNSETRWGHSTDPGKDGQGVWPDQLGATFAQILAVMSIIGILAAVLVPSISTIKETSTDTRVKNDARAIVTAAINYFQVQNGPDDLHTEIVTVTSRVNGKFVSEEVRRSNRWPERLITSNSGSKETAAYVNELPTAGSAVFDKVVHNVVIRDKMGMPISGSDLLSRYSAVDFGALLAGGYLQKKPASADVLTRSRFHNFLWLLNKRAPAGPTGIDAPRNLEVFKLVPITEAESTIELTYDQVF